MNLTFHSIYQLKICLQGNLLVGLNCQETINFQLILQLFPCPPHQSALLWPIAEKLLTNVDKKLRSNKYFSSIRPKYHQNA